MQSIDCVSKLSMTFKCTYVLNGDSKGSGETAQMRRLVWAFRLLAHAIKPPLIACRCLLNALMFWMALARLLRCADSSEFLLLAHAIKPIVDCVIYLCFVKRSKDSGETFLCGLVQSWQPVKRLRFFSEVELANTFLFWKKNVRKIQNAAVIPAIFLDLCEAWINYFIFSFNFQENVYFRFLKLHRGKLFMLSRKTYALFEIFVTLFNELI